MVQYSPPAGEERPNGAIPTAGVPAAPVAAPDHPRSARSPTCALLDARSVGAYRMKQIILALSLIAVPVALFAAFQLFFLSPPSAEASLGDLADLRAIVADVRSIAETGDLAAAAKRVADFETEWDARESGMRPLNEAAWGRIDGAADAALHALRAAAPEPRRVATTLAALASTLDDPYGSGGAEAGLETVAGVPVSDQSGHPLACEAMIEALRSAIDAGKVPADKRPAAADFRAKAVERCNADDDAQADAFAAQGLALASATR
jgi:hypothetical protein